MQIQSYILTYFGIIIHICIHTYIHSILAYIHTDVYVCMLVYVCICVHVYVCMYMYVCICMYMYVCVYVCVYVCMHVCMCMCVCMHTCVCMYVCITYLGGIVRGGNVLPKTGGGIVRGELSRGELSYTQERRYKSSVVLYRLVSKSVCSGLEDLCLPRVVVDDLTTRRRLSAGFSRTVSI